MIELMLILSLSPVNPISAPADSIEPCVWPNTCASQQTAQVEQVEPCVWPNSCASQPEAVAAFQPCGTPNKCKATELAGDFQTCVWPNKCA